MDIRKKKQELYSKYCKNFKDPCIVHATPNPHKFINILEHGILNLPNSGGHELTQPDPLEKILDIHNCIWFSKGFTYNIPVGDSQFKFGFIFDLNIIDKHFEIFHYAIVGQTYKTALRYWRENDPSFLEELKKKNKTVKEYINYFFKTEDETGYGDLFHWHITDYLYPAIKHHKDYKKIVKEIKKNRFKNKIIYNKINRLKRLYNEGLVKTVEIVCHKNISLHTKDLLGFFLSDFDPLKKREINKAFRHFLLNSKNVSNKLIVFNGTQKDLLSNHL